MPWRHEARCAEDDVNRAWFHSTEGREIKHAKLICQGCPVKAQCLEYALTADDNWGVWGGLDDKQRRQLTRGRRVRQAA